MLPLGRTGGRVRKRKPATLGAVIARVNKARRQKAARVPVHSGVGEATQSSAHTGVGEETQSTARFTTSQSALEVQVHGNLRWDTPFRHVPV